MYSQEVVFTQVVAQVSLPHCSAGHHTPPGLFSPLHGRAQILWQNKHTHQLTHCTNLMKAYKSWQSHQLQGNCKLHHWTPSYPPAGRTLPREVHGWGTSHGCNPRRDKSGEKLPNMSATRWGRFHQNRLSHDLKFLQLPFKAKENIMSTFE